MDEFSDNNAAFYMGCPLDFLLGEGIPTRANLTSGSLSKAYIDHLFHHHSLPCNDQRMLSLMFNQLQRHAVIRNVSVIARSQGPSFKSFEDEFNAPDFRAKLAFAVAHPDSPQSKAFLQKMHRVLHVHARKIPGSNAERQATASKMFSLVRFHGMPAHFLTIAWADMDSPLTLRLCTTDENELEALMTDDALGLNRRMRKVVANPGNAAISFQLLLHNVFKHCLGVIPSNTKGARSVPLEQRTKGIYGTTFNAAFATESNGRGSTHGHMLVWGGLSADLLQDVIGNTSLEQEVAKYLNSIANTGASRRGRHFADKVIRRCLFCFRCLLPS